MERLNFWVKEKGDIHIYVLQRLPSLLVGCRINYAGLRESEVDFNLKNQEISRAHPTFGVNT